MTRRRLAVLVVDDSAVVRQALSAILGSRGCEVTTAPDPLFALEKIRRSRPDVIVLDLEMPRMDGLSFLRRLMATDPIPCVVCSSLAGPGSENALRALDEGAVEVVAKPKLAVREFLEESATLISDAVHAAFKARLRAPRPGPPPVEPRHSADAVMRAGLPHAIHTTTDKVIAVGASTGGTEALREILEALPPDAPGIVIVQHMPEVFTRAFADRLDGLCRVRVKEAADGDRVIPGRALIAPGNRHTLLVRSGALYAVQVKDGPLVSRHRPSVDVLFRSVAQAAGHNAVGVILTGMGDDGAAGLLEMKQAGAATVAQDEASCVVFGMPREAIELGAVDHVVGLGAIAATMLRLSGALSRGQPLRN
jgi:two-component system chemotaxis response regulator CheB